MFEPLIWVWDMRDLSLIVRLEMEHIKICTRIGEAESPLELAPHQKIIWRESSLKSFAGKRYSRGRQLMFRRTDQGERSIPLVLSLPSPVSPIPPCWHCRFAIECHPPECACASCAGAAARFRPSHRLTRH